MEITDVRLRVNNEDNSKMKGLASVTFDHEFVVHDIKIIETENSMFISMPSKKMPNGEFKDICHPINSDTREKIQKAIFDKYNALTAE